ncbi:type II secretion system F family protein [Candidatus Woesearchaeota archaeon]|nr:type II secretion system F family protein [Candidatus Woesearchaeota archaeon]
MSFFYNLGKSILPERIRQRIGIYLEKTGKYEVPFDTYGKVFVFSFAISILAYALLLYSYLKSAGLALFLILSFLSLTALQLGLVFVMLIGFWLYYEFVIFRRTREIEEVLPDFLEQVSVNLRAGMSFDRALWNSVNPDFGVLEREIEIVSKKVMTGDDTEQALKEFANKYNSTLLQESMDMIIIGIRAGGNISELIDRVVANVKEVHYLNEELIASVTSYVIFISVIAVVISPVLFALSFNLMQIIQGLGDKLTVTNYGNVLNFGDNLLNPKDFILFSKIAIVIIAGISSLIIADLREGSIKAGLKYIVLFAPIAYIIYLVALAGLSGAFGVVV